ncbi:hypothetical protein AAGS61_10200 [Lysinibacillus sp. KU-BSD001]|uniref:hypothetical protein n=1 Tax=Lysinibacillus sp. KU-BSD001 TaxID=3141328 RepID=UPI0036DFABD7
MFILLTKDIVPKEELHTTTLEMVKEKLHEKYVGVDVKITSKKELIIQIVGDEQYVDSVKKDMASIAKRVLQTTTLKDYTIVFERWEFISDENKMINKELHHLTATLMDGLKVYDVFENITIENQSSIIIQTSINSSDQAAHILAMEMEGTVHDILHSKERNSLSNIDSYEINILNAKGKVIN